MSMNKDIAKVVKENAKLAKDYEDLLKVLSTMENDFDDDHELLTNAIGMLDDYVIRVARLYANHGYSKEFIEGMEILNDDDDLVWMGIKFPSKQS